MSFFADIENIFGKGTVGAAEKEGMSYNVKDDQRETLTAGVIEEDLLDMKTKFYSGDDDDYKTEKNKYINNEFSYMNRINTYSMWTKKPLHLCAIVLARNGYICEDENTIRCEMCGCAYIYEKNSYSVYTQISDLCLLHEDNCPWKNTLMELSFFKLDKASLQRDELLKEYTTSVKMLEEALYEIPLIDIKKTVKNLEIIIKRHLEKDNESAKNYSIFNWYVTFFKNQFAPIFSKNEKVIEKGIAKIKKDYPEYEKYIIDMKFINNLQFDLCDESNYLNILCDGECPLKDEKEEDVNRYLKIVAKLRSRDFEEANIFKLLAFFGWTYKADSVDNNNNFTQILQCKYCFREVKISNFSSYSTRDKKLMLFKEINSVAEGKEIFRDALNKKKVFQKNTIGNEGEIANSSCMKGSLCLKSNNEDWEARINEHLYSLINEYSVTNNTTSPVKSVLSTSSNLGINSNDAFHGDRVSNSVDKSNEVLNTPNKEGEESKFEAEKKKVEKEKEASKSSEADAEESLFKWKKKELILTRKNKDFFKTRSGSHDISIVNNSMKRSSLFSKKQKNISGDVSLNRKESFFRSGENTTKEVFSKNSLSKVCLAVSNYLKGEAPFMKTLYGYYILRDSNFFKLDENTRYEQNKKHIHPIRLFDVIENHRIYCPYLTEDLYSFSKITKLFFELLLSEFKQRYAFDK